MATKSKVLWFLLACILALSASIAFAPAALAGLSAGDFERLFQEGLDMPMAETQAYALASGKVTR
jgi:hypothetical protein